MTYTVFITPEAEANIHESFIYIRERSPINADRWLAGIQRKISTLSSFPNRCARAREHAYFPKRNLRQLIYKSHRIIFEVEAKARIVRIVYVRHAARRSIGEPDED